MSITLNNAQINRINTLLKCLPISSRPIVDMIVDEFNSGEVTKEDNK